MRRARSCWTKPANALIVANDKGIGTRYSFETDYGVCGYNTHQDNGTVSIVPVPNSATLADDDEAGFPEQPLGSGAKYPVCLLVAARMPSRSQSRPRSAIRR